MPDSKITDLPSLTTPTDNDVTVIVDVLDTSQSPSGTDKKLSWANIKATLKTYFDGIYANLNGSTLTSTTLTSPVINTGVSGTAIDTDGTLAANSDTKIPSQKAVKTYADASHLKSKIKTDTRDMTAVSGDVSYTGVGFIPSAIVAFANIDGARVSFGMADSAKTAKVVQKDFDNNFYNQGASNFDGLAYYAISAGNSQGAIVKTFDADGFTLTWTKVGTPTGTLKLSFMCLR